MFTGLENTPSGRTQRQSTNNFQEIEGPLKILNRWSEITFCIAKKEASPIMIRPTVRLPASTRISKKMVPTITSVSEMFPARSAKALTSCPTYQQENRMNAASIKSIRQTGLSGFPFRKGLRIMTIIIIMPKWTYLNRVLLGLTQIAEVKWNIIRNNAQIKTN